MNSLLKMSVENCKPIMIFYLDTKGEISQRIITVKAINKTFIKAYCHWRKAERIFKLENILSCGRVGKKGA